MRVAGDWVFYTPPVGFTNADSFPFTVSDGRGGISSVTATISVIADNATSETLRAELAGDGSIRVRGDGIPGRTYAVEFTERLENPDWQRLALVGADGVGAFQYVDRPPDSAPSRYYRAIQP